MRKISRLPHFFIGFPQVPRPVVSVWRQLATFLAAHEALPKMVELSQMVGHPESLRNEAVLKLPVQDVDRVISERNLEGFKIYSGAGSKSADYYLTDYAGARQDSILACYLESRAKAPSSWNALIEAVISAHSTVGAWQYLSLYQWWQRDNAGDRFYERRWGKLPPGYRTWSEPGPLALTPQPDRIFLDISMNPGRWKQITPMISFLPTAEMWLGPHFWQYAKCTKEEALAAEFFIEKRDTPQFLYLKCWPQPFTRPDGEQGRMQQRLWRLFFHEDCEWPPGSGTICDEPMYGPPELMP